MGDFIILLNIHQSKKEQYMYVATEQDTLDIYKEPVLDSTFGISNPQVNHYLLFHDVLLFGLGDIKNTQDIFHKLQVKQETTHIFEVIIWIYIKYGIEHVLNVIEGYVSFVLVDYRDYTTYPKIYVVRDPLGVTPLWQLKTTNMLSSDYVLNNPLENIIAITTNQCYLHNLLELFTTQKHNLHISPFSPGTFRCYTHSEKTCTNWISNKADTVYYTFPIAPYVPPMYKSIARIAHIESAIDRSLIQLIDCIKYSMRKLLVLNSKNPGTICIRLDGDILSVLLVAIAKSFKHTTTIQTFSCGPAQAKWLAISKQISDILQTKHTEIIIANNNCNSSIKYSNKPHNQTLLGKATANYVSKYINAKYVILPLGSCLWESSLDTIDILQNNINVRNKIKKVIPTEFTHYLKEFWCNDISTLAPYIEKPFLELFLGLGMKYNIHSTYCIKRLLQLLCFTNNDMLLRLDAYINQTKEWEFMDNTYEINSSLLEWDKKNNSIYC